MLPKNLSTTYQQYKNGTDSIANWLATTAEKIGYVSEARSKKAKRKAKAKAKPSGDGTQSQPLPQGRQTYTIAIKDFTILAEYIAAKDEVEVPPKLAALLDRTISLRQSYSATISSSGVDEDPEKSESDDRHAFFLGVLKKVQNLLRPRYAKAYIPVKKEPESIEEVINMFEKLELEVPSEGFKQAPDVARAEVDSAASNATYKAERVEGMQEDFFAFLLLLHDLNRLRNEVKTAWEGYKQGLIDLVAASITTNTAVDLARAMEDDMKDTLQKYGGAPTMLDMYYVASCMGAGTSVSHKERRGDDLNFKMYALADAIFIPTQRLLGGFCDAMEDGRTMEMKPGFYGIYNPSSDRSRKNARDRFLEDKIFLLEMLTEFSTACHASEQFPAEDELTRGLRAMFKTKELTLSLSFAATLFLDIHHILRAQVDSCFGKLQKVASYAQNSIDQNFEFHKDLHIDNWPRANDDALKEFSDFITKWIRDDVHTKIARYMNRMFMPKPYYLYRKHPWLCGLWKYHIQIRLHEIGIAFSNAWGSIMSCVHIYNAIQGEKMNTSQWKDMDVAISLQGADSFFVGDPPKSPEGYLKRFAMAMGLSATEYAKPSKTKKKNKNKKGLLLSKRGPHSMKELGAVLQTFKGRYCDMNGRYDLRMEDVQSIVDKCTWGYEMNEDGQPAELFKDSDIKPGGQKGHARQLPVAKLLGLLRAMLHAEMIEISFDFLCLHRQCWRLLCSLRDHCRDQLIKVYGPKYMEKETELPFVVGYILMTASTTQHLDTWMNLDQTTKVSSSMLQDAAYVVEGLAGSEAASLIVERLLPDMLGVEIAFETEQEH
ncbi:hypothetical protein K504DRAFT_452005 [Pleomassaria siparia CBS 279.74]|uniref:DUF6604 domain-containing protein n=1 Tax=Pleomassaria siparia CBS 279.74 TaxID=1314801 RepID=A0A6G1JR05_9PLEO|nr:hypothetical protein K504DRAFT_452005 [Pleomassaria siparia CBS 279.74]